jgi:hypothetical protein
LLLLTWICCPLYLKSGTLFLHELEFIVKANDNSETSLNLEGFQSQQRVVEALPLRIDYQSPRYAYRKRQTADEWVFQFPAHGRPIRKECHLDPYAVRCAFEQVVDVDGALRFLRASGQFWPFRSITWTQFQEWQEFFSWLRIQPEIASLEPRGLRAWATASRPQNCFFSQSDEFFTISRLPIDVDDVLLREKLESDSEWLRALRGFVLMPEGPKDEARISVCFYDSTLPQSPEDWDNRHSTKMSGDHWMPYLAVEAYTAIEAIAATIYADQIHGLRHARCKHCNRIFKVESEHGQVFCPAPAHLNSSPCKNAYLQTQRRGNEKRAIEFLFECWDLGLHMPEIRSKAESLSIRLTAQIIAKAKGRNQRTAKAEKGCQHGIV